MSSPPPPPTWVPPQPTASTLLYRGAPITLVNAVAAQQAGTWTKKPLRTARWGLGDVAITLVAWLILSIVAVIPVLALTDSGGATKAGVSSSLLAGLSIVAVVVPWIGMAGWPIFITKFQGNGPAIDLGIRWSWRDIGFGLLWGLGALAVAVAVGAVTSALFGEFNSAAGELGESVEDNKVLLVLFALTVAVGAPIVEEICFRGLLFGSLVKKNMPPWVAVLVTAAVFSLIHLEPIRIALLFGIGLMLALARWKTGSLTSSIVAHMSVNFIGAVGLLFGTT